jgi:UDP-glucose 4-epimerase
MLRKAALKLPIFPDIRNERSMLFIDNLCAYVRIAVAANFSGIHLLQNKEYVCTSEMVRQIALAHSKKIRLTKIFNPLLKLLSGKIDVVDKAFGGLVYESNDFHTGHNISDISLEESIRMTEGRLST